MFRGLGRTRGWQRICRVQWLAAFGVFAACAGEARTDDVDQSRADSSAAVQIPGPAATPVQAPDSFQVLFKTNKGNFTVNVQRRLAPLGADRFYELVKVGYFSDVRFFRMVPGFVAQFGVHGDPAVYALWKDAVLPDEPMRTGNVRGTVAFTTNGPDSRAVQLFINTGDNRSKLDGQRVFAPLGSVVEGMNVVDSLNAEYGEEPNQSRMTAQGNRYLSRWFPALDYIERASVVTP